MAFCARLRDWCACFRDDDFDEVSLKLSDSDPKVSPDQGMEENGKKDYVFQIMGDDEKSDEEDTVRTHIIPSQATGGTEAKLLPQTRSEETLGDRLAGAIRHKSYASMGDVLTKDSVKIVCESLGTGGVEAIAKALETDTSIQSLELGVNACGVVRAFPAIAHMLKANKALTELSVWGNQITDSACKNLATGLLQRAPLRVLRLNNNVIGSKGVTHLAPGFHRLRVIDFAGNKIDDIAADVLVNALKKAVQDGKGVLEELHLSSNLITDKGGCAVASLLGSNQQHIALIDLSSCRIGDQTVVAMARAVPSAPAIFAVDLRNNANIGSIGRQALSRLERGGVVTVDEFKDDNEGGQDSGEL